MLNNYNFPPHINLLDKEEVYYIKDSALIFIHFYFWLRSEE